MVLNVWMKLIKEKTRTFHQSVMMWGCTVGKSGGTWEDISSFNSRSTDEKVIKIDFLPKKKKVSV